MDGVHDPAIAPERPRACRRPAAGRHARHPDAVRRQRSEPAPAEQADRPCARCGARGAAPGPRTVAVVERDMIRDLLARGHIVVACGGGGPPAYPDPVLGLEGIDAVADKDRVAAVLGREIAAYVLLILTNVDAV